MLLARPCPNESCRDNHTFQGNDFIAHPLRESGNSHFRDTGDIEFLHHGQQGSGPHPQRFRTLGTADHHRLRRPPALKVRADPPLQTLDTVPSPIVFARRWHSGSVLSTSQNAQRPEQLAGSGRSPSPVPEIQSIRRIERAASTCEWYPQGLGSTSALAGPRSHQTVDRTPFPPDRLRQSSHFSSLANARAHWPSR